jgi:hypothetical protein
MFLLEGKVGKAGGEDSGGEGLWALLFVLVGGFEGVGLQVCGGVGGCSS